MILNYECGLYLVAFCHMTAWIVRGIHRQLVLHCVDMLSILGHSWHGIVLFRYSGWTLLPSEHFCHRICGHSIIPPEYFGQGIIPSRIFATEVLALVSYHLNILAMVSYHLNILSTEVLALISYHRQHTSHGFMSPGHSGHRGSGHGIITPGGSDNKGNVKGGNEIHLPNKLCRYSSLIQVIKHENE